MVSLPVIFTHYEFFPLTYIYLIILSDLQSQKATSRPYFFSIDLISSSPFISPLYLYVSSYLFALYLSVPNVLPLLLLP